MRIAESARVQEYLRLLYDLYETGEEARTALLAKRLGISLPSVTEMLKKLAENGYITHRSYHSATLTNKGRRAAEKITRKHRLLECFLHDILKIGKNRVHKEACELEHALSNEVEDALCKVLQHPENCPDDKKPIPICDKRVTNCVKCVTQQRTR